VLVIGNVETLQLQAEGDWKLCAVEKSSPLPELEGEATGVMLYDAASGALLTVSVPNPEMPVGEEGLQTGLEPGSGGHLLPCMSAVTIESGLVLGGLIPGTDSTVTLPGAKLDDEGFVWFAA
jgi:hypothetical protein